MAGLLDGIFSLFGGGGNSPPSKVDPGDAGPAPDPASLDGIFTGSGIAEGDAKTNPLNGYINTTYHVELAMLPFPGRGGGAIDTAPAPGGVMSQETQMDPLKNPAINNYKRYEELASGKVIFARTGGAAGDTYLNIVRTTIGNVTAVSSANPGLAQVTEIGLEFVEPSGVMFDFWMRKAAAELGYTVTPFRCVWRLSIWWSGYRPNGTWVDKIPFKSQTGTEFKEIVYHCHAATLEAGVKATGTTYNMTLFPIAFAAMQRDAIISEAIQINCENSIQGFIAEFTKTINAKFAAKKMFHTVEIKLPNDSFGSQPLVDKSNPKRSDFAQFNTDDGSSVRFNLPPNSTITNLILQSFANVSMEGIEKELGDDVAVTLVVKPDVDYSAAEPNSKFNDYTKIKYIYSVEPFYTWRFLKNDGSVGAANNGKALALGSKVKSYGMVRRYYNYAWTSTNTEVLSLDLKLKLLWFVDIGLTPIEQAPVHGLIQGTVASPEEVNNDGRKLNDQFNEKVDGTGSARAALAGTPGGSTPNANAVPHKSGGGGAVSHGRWLPNMNAGALRATGNRTQNAKLTFSEYQQNFERMISADTGQLEGMRVRGDPRWLINYGQYASSESSAGKWSRISTLIRINIKAPNQSEYMSPGSGQRQNDLSFGGYYEIAKIDTQLERGGFTQTLAGYRLFNMADG